MRILVADDEEHVRSAIALLLQQQLDNVELCETSTAADTLDCVQTYTFDLILLDWELSKNEMQAILGYIRTAQPNVIIIALSGRPETRCMALNAGADTFVSKGDPPEYLLTAVLEYTLHAAKAERHIKARCTSSIYL